MDNRLVLTVVGIVLAIGVPAGLFIGINKLFDLTETRFRIFNSIVGGSAALVVFALLWGNRVLANPAIITIVAVVIGAALGLALGMLDKPVPRLTAGLIGGVAIGVVLGVSVRSFFWPSIDPVAAVVGLAVGAALGILHWLTLRSRYQLLPILFAWLALGWLVGGWLAADFSFTLSGENLTGEANGTQLEAIIVAAVLGLLIGAWFGTVPHPDKIKRAHVSEGSRKYIFLFPALFFVFAGLVMPLGRTIWLGFLSGGPAKFSFAGFDNYAKVFSDPEIIDFSNWTSIFSSVLFWVAVFLGIVGVALAMWLGRRGGSGTGTGFEFNAGTTMILGGAVILAGFAIFIYIRGTISNNVWWVFAVTLFSVATGLAIAVIADRSRGENFAKSLIFLPMSISFVGASIIWRGPMYIARPAGDEQTGVMNALWIKLGEWSNSTTASTVIVVVLALIIAGLLYLAWRGWQAGSNSMLFGSAIFTLPFIWLIYQFLGPGIGGFTINSAGDVVAEPYLFVQTNPWNNFWMMVVFIWIQTGFAMVIFSAAIKAVPEELMEAARIDGATEGQTFWRVTVPQIFPTIGVVTTTLIITVLKVFDIPKVMTNGNFDTQVLANEMWQRAFTELNFGLGSALAVLIFIGVLPVMYLNIRRMQKERLS
ncbi:MAG TPA: sugar ABC transporter permease [Acidimicrobiia bacterium]|nr:sugar ABC transporter permease [Acidimicrobiia bacterium]